MLLEKEDKWKKLRKRKLRAFYMVLRKVVNTRSNPVWLESRPFARQRSSSKHHLHRISFSPSFFAILRNPIFFDPRSLILRFWWCSISASSVKTFRQSTSLTSPPPSLSSLLWSLLSRASLNQEVEIWYREKRDKKTSNWNAKRYRQAKDKWVWER